MRARLEQRDEPGLVGEARARHAVPPTRRELVAALATSASFTAATALFALRDGVTAPSGAALVLLAAAFVVCTRFELELASGSALPTQLVFVPMLFTLPLPLVPATVACALLANHAIDVARGGVHAARAFAVLGASWFSLPPALVLAAAGRPIGWHHWPLYLAAFAAQCGADFGRTLFYEGAAHGVALGELLVPLGRVFVLDGLLSVTGLLAVPGLDSGRLGFLALSPLLLVVAALSRERRGRLDVELEAAELDHLASEDPLTRLGNRRKLMLDLESALRPGSGSWLLALLDLDAFKQFNDTYGHPAGDALLARVGGALQELVPGRAYRLGGDEFCLLVPAPADVEAFCEHCRDALGRARGEYVRVASIGIAHLPGEATNPTHALSIADERLYADKRSRRRFRDTSDTEPRSPFAGI